jgi:CBS domain-containing protein
MEQTLLTDQDNALVYAEEGAQHREWYQALAYRANEDLTKAGFPRCPGGYMASRLHATRAEWQERFASWARESDPQGTLDAAIFVDFRAVAGALDVGPLDDAMIVAARPPFLRALAKSALGFRPPSALTRLRDTTTVDLKRGAIAPMATLARVYALEIGASARGTAQRIEAAARAGKIDAEAGGVLAETYRFLLELRLRHQLAALAAGRAPSDGVVLAELTGVQRSRLRDAFRAIRGWQERAAQHFQTNV